MESQRILDAVFTADQVTLAPLLDNVSEADLFTLQNNLAFFDAQLRKAIQRKHGVAQGNG